jgi:sensor histidine kinase regulating citrate/malate metabolism
MIKSIVRIAAITFAFTAALSTAATGADDREAKLRRLVDTKILPIVQNSIVVESVKDQNQKFATLDERQIRRLDKIWRDEAERAGGALISEVLANPLSNYLKQVKRDHGNLFAEIYVMDNKGLNVGQTDMTPDFWQGDEGKWQKTFLAGRGAVRISKGKKRNPQKDKLARVTVTIVDPTTNEVIGAVTIGVNVDEMS